MIIRFEVAARKNFYWKHFLQRAKKHGRHRSRRDGVHVVEVLGLDHALEIWQLTRSWKAVWYYVAGQAVGQARFNDLMVKHQFRDIRTKRMLTDVITVMAVRRDRRQGGG